MLENILLLKENYFNSLLRMIIENDRDNESYFNSIENFCIGTPLYIVSSNLLQIKFDKLHTIHSKIIPKNILWTTIVDSTINPFDFKYNYHQIIKNIENINFEPIVFYDVKRENYRLLFHYFKDKLSDDFSSIIIVIKGIPEIQTDIINFDVFNVK
jgi:hypothetical protein